MGRQQKIKDGVNVKAAERKKILTSNVDLIDKVRNRVNHNFQVFEVSKSFPLKCDNCNAQRL